MVDVDEFVGDRRLVDENPEPSEGIDPLVGAQLLFRDRAAADAVKTVAARDVIACDLERLPVLDVTDPRPLRLEIVKADLERFVDRLRAQDRARVHQIARRLGLAIDRDGLAGQRLEIDAMAHAVERDLGPFVDESLAMQPRARARFVEEGDSITFSISNQFADAVQGEPK